MRIIDRAFFLSAWPTVCAYLARILSTSLIPGTEEDVRYKLVPAGPQEHRLAPVVTHYRHGDLQRVRAVVVYKCRAWATQRESRPGYNYLLQHRGQRAALAQPSPAGDRRVLPDQEVVRGRQADGRDVRGEGQGTLEPYQRQVVLVREEVVLGVHDLLGDAALDVGQPLLHGREVVLADSYPDLRRQQAATGEETERQC